MGAEKQFSKSYVNLTLISLKQKSSSGLIQMLCRCTNEKSYAHFSHEFLFYFYVFCTSLDILKKILGMIENRHSFY